jgi:hypothetical protein
MDSLDNLIGATPSPVSLDTIVGNALPPLTAPQSTIRNRAATLALASDSEKPVEDFQIMQAEGMEGRSEYTDYVHSKIDQQNTEADRKVMLNVLADKTATYEQKRQAIEGLRTKAPKIEPSQALYMKNITKPSYGESRDAEDARANAAVYATQQLQAVREERQAIINAHVAGFRDANLETFGEAGVYMAMPFGTSIAQAREVAAMGGSKFDMVKAFFLPGSSKEQIKAKIAATPVEQRNEVIRNWIDNVQKSGVILSDNQFQQFFRISETLEEGGYDSVDKFFDNFAAIIDVVGAGALVRSAAKSRKAANVQKAAEGSQQVNAPTAPPAQAAPTSQAPVTKPTPSYEWSVGNRSFEDTQNQVGAFQQGLIDKLQAEKASLLGDAGNLADKGAVAKINEELKTLRSQPKIDAKELAKELQKSEKLSYKAALTKAEKEAKSSNDALDSRISRLEGQLEANRTASTVSQRIDAIDKEIAELEKVRVGMPTQKTPIADFVSRIRINESVRSSNPLAPHSVLKQSNPEQAANSFEAIFKSEGDEVAQAMTGTTKERAIADDIMPQAVTDSGRVTAQPVDIQRNLRREAVPERVWEFLGSIGRMDYTPAEKAIVRSNVQNDFRSAEGLHLHESMGGFRTKFEAQGDKVVISAIYGKADGAWSSAKDARDQAMLSLRKYGILESEVQIMKLDGLDYVPVKYEDVVDQPGSYMIKIDTESVIDPTDITNFEDFSTRFTFFERMPASFMLQGGIGSHIWDAASRFDPKITHGATVAQDYTAKLEKILLDHAAEYSNSWKKLSKDSQQRVDAYILEANLKEVKMDVIDMRTRLGMSDDEISTVQKWRNFWDGQFYLENDDLIRTYNEEGYELFRNATDEFHVKPVAKNVNIYNQHNIYDPATQSTRLVSKKEVDELYDKGGTLAKMRRPVNINGEMVEHMIVRQTPTEYTRKFRSTDQVLNYREGYFTIHYDKPRFVDEITVDANGKEIRRAVAVGKDSVETKAYVDRMMKNAPPGVRYEHRADDRMMRRGSDDWFDIEAARGRIAQRHRGKNLEEATGMNHLGGMSLVEDPVFSAIKSAKSVAGRTITRPVLESAKARIKQKYSNLFPSDGMGGIKWPSNLGEIGAKGKELSKEVAEARANWAYINYLENGYINGIDDMFKQNFYAISEMLGEKGFGKAQRATAELGHVNPTAGAKQFVFTAMIAGNPFRQVFVQTHQAIRAAFYNPQAFLNGKLMSQVVEHTYHKAGLSPATDFSRFVDDSGMWDAVDRHNLVRGTLLDAAEGRSLATRAPAKAMEVVQQVGFNLGERLNMLMTLSAVYDKYKRAGKNLLDPDVKAMAYSEARAVSYEMNFAGDMPYNQTSMALFMQFLQVPHKAILQFANRKLTRSEKARLLIGDVVMWGPPILLINEAAQGFFGEDILPENPKLRKGLVEGLESYMLNAMMDTELDFSSLAPYDLTGFSKMMAGFYEGGLSAMWANSPTSQMFGEQGRVRVALRSMLRFMGVQEPVGASPDTFMMALTETGKIFSGVGHAYKAHLLLEAEKRFDAYGRPAGDMQRAVEAFYQVLGFEGKSRKELFALSQATSKAKKDYESEIDSVYRETLRYAQNRFASGVNDLDQLNSITQFMLSKYQHDPVAMEIINKKLARDIMDPKLGLMAHIVKSSNMPTMSGVIDEIKLGPYPEEEKQKAIRLIEDAKKIREMKKETK